MIPVATVVLPTPDDVPATTTGERVRGRSSRRFAPAGQTTQMIVGATPSSDAAILETASTLYGRYKLRRVYYSASTMLCVPHSLSLRGPALGAQAGPDGLQAGAADTGEEVAYEGQEVFRGPEAEHQADPRVHGLQAWLADRGLLALEPGRPVAEQRDRTGGDQIDDGLLLVGDLGDARLAAGLGEQFHGEVVAVRPRAAFGHVPKCGTRVQGVHEVAGISRRGGTCASC